MNPAANTTARPASQDVLARYVASVRQLNLHMHRITAGNDEIAGNLSRAAAALRSIASARAERQSRLVSPER